MLETNVHKLKQNSVFYFVLFYGLVSVKFFLPKFFDLEDLSRYIYIILNIFVFGYFMKTLFIKRDDLKFFTPIKWICISIIISIISANIYREQPIIDCFMAALFPVAAYTLYFYLIERKVSLRTVERVFVIIGLLALFTFFINFFAFPLEIFTNSYKEDLLDRGFQRIQLSGFGFIYLLTFYSVNKAVVMKNKIWLILSIVCLVAIFLSLTRTYILFTMIIVSVYYFRKLKLIYRILIVALVFFAVTISTQLEVVQNLVETTQNDLDKQDDYVRIQAAAFFLNEFQVSEFTRIFGSGFAYGAKTAYGRFIVDMKKSMFYIEDLGIIGLYIYMGVIAVIAYFVIFYRGMRAKLPEELTYLKMFLAFILLISLNSYATFSSNFLVGIVLVFYAYELSSKQI